MIQNQPFFGGLTVLNRFTAIASLFALTLALAVPLLVQETAGAAPFVANNSFEAVPFAPTTFGEEYTPTFGSLPATAHPDWTFGASAGDSYDGMFSDDPASAGVNLSMGTLPSGQGHNVAFVEGTGAISQSISGFDGSTSYNFTFWAEGLPPAYTNNLSDPVTVKIDSTVIALITPPQGTWTQYTTDTFLVSAGAHTLSFTGVVPFSVHDDLTRLDLININEVSVPEPASLGLLTLGAFAFFRRRR